MEHKYIEGKEIPFFDAEITELIEGYKVEGGGKPMDVGVENEKGEVYRLVRCWGLGEYIHFTQSMLGLGFDNLLVDSPSQGGLDNRFAVTDEVLQRKTAVAVKEETVVEEIAGAEESLEGIGETERSSIIKSRLGQGIFRQQLVEYWQGCAVTGATFIPMLKASHIKPWRNSTNEERLDTFNGFLLSPALDAAFDCGLISFEKSGRIMLSKRISGTPAYEFHITQKMRIKRLESEHERYLAYHRDHVFVGG